MSANHPDENMVSLEEACKLLEREFGSTPDVESIKKLVKDGFLNGSESNSTLTINKQSLDSLIEQLQKTETKREARLTLHSVDIWRRESDKRAVAVTLSTKAHVVTNEQICEKDDYALLEAAV